LLKKKKLWRTFTN